MMLTGICIVLTIIAATPLLDPVMRYVHSDKGGFWQLALCVLVAVLGLRLAYMLLNTICRYYSGLFDERINKESTVK